MTVRYLGSLILGVALFILTGCSGPSGPPRFGLSGAVKYNGQPVPRGTVSLEPDPAKGNKGPGVTSQILDGKFSIPPERGTVGGPHLVRISGLDGKATKVDNMEYPDGKALFPDYNTEADLPKSNSTRDFEVPATK